LPREKLTPFDNVDDDESFEQQMADLGVEVVRPKTKIEWYKTEKARAGKVGLRDKVSINSMGITLGGEVVKKIGEEPRVKVAVVKTKKIAGGEKITFILKPGQSGLKICRTKSNSHRIGTKALAEWLISKGIKKGRYSLKEIKGGYMAVKEETK